MYWTLTHLCASAFCQMNESQSKHKEFIQRSSVQSVLEQRVHICSVINNEGSSQFPFSDNSTLWPLDGSLWPSEASLRVFHFSSNLIRGNIIPRAYLRQLLISSLRFLHQEEKHVSSFGCSAFNHKMFLVGEQIFCEIMINMINAYEIVDLRA